MGINHGRQAFFIKKRKSNNSYCQLPADVEVDAFRLSITEYSPKERVPPVMAGPGFHSA